MTDMAKNRSKRILNVELLRIVAYLMVITNHILNKHYMVKGEMYDAVCLWNMFNIVSVPCFFMITGAFVFDNFNYKKQLKKAFTSILIPTLIAIVLIMQLYPQLTGGWENFSIKGIFTIDQARYAELWDKIRVWDINMAGVSHLWYIQSYIKIILLLPVLAALCSDNKTSDFARRFIILFTLFGQLINNIRTMAPGVKLISAYLPFNTSTLAVLLGYEIYHYIIPKRSHDWKTAAKYFAGYAAFSVLGYLWEKGLMIGKTEFNDYFFHYASVPCQLASCCLFIAFCIAPLRLPEKASAVVYFVARLTFVAYLMQGIVNVPMTQILNKLHIPALPKYLLTAIVCSIISLLIAFVWYWVGKLLKMLVSRLSRAINK